MSKYIDAEKLIAEIDKLKEMYLVNQDKFKIDDIDLSIFYEGKSKMCDEILFLLSHLQQEQPKVDLDREIIKYKVPFTDEREYLNETTLDAIAHHFAEWGAIHLSTRKEQEQSECIYGRTLEERKKYCKFCSAICEARIEQEQPDEDLEKEYNEQWGGYTHDGLSVTIDRVEFEQLARHFYELGLKARKV